MLGVTHAPVSLQNLLRYGDCVQMDRVSIRTPDKSLTIQSEISFKVEAAPMA